MIDLLNADYTFVDETLARHYGIPDVHGSRFRRVTVTDDARRGLLGQASFLLVTSVANRTSPVARGKWILENLLGTAPPLPPPNVPPLKDNEGGVQPTSLRAEDGRAPQEPGLRGVPQDHGPDRLLARELRLDRAVAHHGRRQPHRCFRPTGGWHQTERAGQPAARRCCAAPMCSSGP